MNGISVIIPTYNRQDKTDNAVKSVLDQTDLPDEIIVVDDGSTIPYRPLDNRVKIIKHNTNRGAAAARNTGIKAATRRWVGFLDSDDTWHKDRIARVLPHLLRISDNKCVLGCGFKYSDTENGTEYNVIPKNATTVNHFASGCWFCPGSCMVATRELFLQIGMFNEHLRRLEDYEWFLRLAKAGGTLDIIPDVSVDINKGKRPDYRLIKKTVAALENELVSLPPTAQRKARAFLKLEMASAHWYSDMKVRGVLALAQSFCIYPRHKLQLR